MLFDLKEIRMGQNKRQPRAKEWARDRVDVLIGDHIEEVCWDMEFAKLLKEGLLVEGE